MLLLKLKENMHNIFLSLGSNLGNKKKNIAQALVYVKEKTKIIHISSYYETEPVGYLNQPSFLNIAVHARTLLSPLDLLSFLQTIEKKLKKSKTQKNGPRTIDMDLLFYDHLILKEPHLVIPHPRISQRAFVLGPLSEIAPSFVHPVAQKTIQEIFIELSTKKKIKKIK